MSTRILPLWLFALLLLAGRCPAHIGSPDVFYDGQAGPYPVRIAIRPPATLPGSAAVTVIPSGQSAAAVSVQAVFWESTSQEPPAPVAAELIDSTGPLYSADVWLLRRGSYAMRIEISGPQGAGTVSVPIRIAPLQEPSMPMGVAVPLALGGALLVLTAIWLTTLAAPANLARRAGLLATLVIVAAIYAGGRRWQMLDTAFRQHIVARPLPIEARVESEAGFHRLILSPGADPLSGSWDALVPDHGKLLHLFLVSTDGARTFAHLHPVRRGRERFETVLPALPAGDYELYAEATRTTGAADTFIARVSLPAPSAPPSQNPWTAENESWCQSPLNLVGDGPKPTALDMDDSWHSGQPNSAPADLSTQAAKLADGSTLLFENAGALNANVETTLRFRLFLPNGEAAALQPYMGMAGHAVVRLGDGSVFAHLHPLGNVSMAAQRLVSTSSGTDTASLPPTSGNVVTFPYAFPKPGTYRLWIQVRSGGRIVTGAFDVPVR